MEIFEILLQHNARIDLVSSVTNEATLHSACRGKTKAHVAIAEKLLELGANPHRADSKGNSAYIYAEKNDYKEMMNLFSKTSS